MLLPTIPDGERIEAKIPKVDTKLKRRTQHTGNSMKGRLDYMKVQ